MSQDSPTLREAALKGYTDLLQSRYISLHTGTEGANVEQKTYQELAKQLVHDYAKRRLDVTDNLPDIDVYVVWFCKVLQNWKCLLSTTLSDGMYYEVTYDGDKDKAYLDAYKKFDNIEVSFGKDSAVDVKSMHIDPRGW